MTLVSGQSVCTRLSACLPLRLFVVFMAAQLACMLLGAISFHMPRDNIRAQLLDGVPQSIMVPGPRQDTFAECLFMGAALSPPRGVLLDVIDSRLTTFSDHCAELKGAAASWGEKTVSYNHYWLGDAQLARLFLSFMTIDHLRDMYFWLSAFALASFICACGYRHPACGLGMLFFLAGFGLFGFFNVFQKNIGHAPEIFIPMLMLALGVLRCRNDRSLVLLAGGLSVVTSYFDCMAGGLQFALVCLLLVVGLLEMCFPRAARESLKLTVGITTAMLAGVIFSFVLKQASVAAVLGSDVALMDFVQQFDLHTQSYSLGFLGGVYKKICVIISVLPLFALPPFMNLSQFFNFMDGGYIAMAVSVALLPFLVPGNVRAAFVPIVAAFAVFPAWIIIFFHHTTKHMHFMPRFLHVPAVLGYISLIAVIVFSFRGLRRITSPSFTCKRK